MDRQKHTPRRTLAAVAVLVVPFAAACGSEKAGGGSGAAEAERPVTGVRWSVDSVTVDGATHRAPDGAHLTLGEDGRATGSYGCNLFEARVRTDGDRVRLMDPETTLRACDEQVMKGENAVSRALAAGELKSDVEGGRLTLTTASGDTVRLSEAQDSPLHGTRWNVTTPDGAGRAHLTFDKKRGTVSGNLGCNQVNADATVRDGHITLGVPSLTRMMCEDSLMDAEKALTKLFNGTGTYAVDGDALRLTSENGTEVRAVAAR
ncbi:META domain-containing protein [Streptomyces werraensis]|jgi:heat shock protein HslJ|uniref:META domain-containing protein n=1 Tax=Streptomyces werraensis TaxID=68284 RepID=UPI00382DE485